MTVPEQVVFKNPRQIDWSVAAALFCLIHGMLVYWLIGKWMPAIHSNLGILAIGIIEIAAIGATLDGVVWKVSASGLELSSPSSISFGSGGSGVIAELALVLLLAPFLLMEGYNKRCDLVPWDKIESVSLSKRLFFRGISLNLSQKSLYAPKRYAIAASIADSEDFRAAISQFAPEEHPFREFLASTNLKS